MEFANCTPAFTEPKAFIPGAGGGGGRGERGKKKEKPSPQMVLDVVPNSKNAVGLALCQ